MNFGLLLLLCTNRCCYYSCYTLLTKKDIVYRNNAVDIKAIVAVGEEPIIQHINDARSESPSIQHLISVGPIIPDGWVDFHKGIETAKTFVRPTEPTKNDDPLLSASLQEQQVTLKMVLLDSVYPLPHIVTVKYWHNLREDSIHLIKADTGWLKAVWGKLYGQWIVGANVFVYDHEKFNPRTISSV